MKPRPTTQQELAAAFARVREATAAFEQAMNAPFVTPGNFDLYKAARAKRDQYVTANQELLKVLEQAYRIFELDAARAAGLLG